MLDLESTRWGELDHAYGKADDIPALLRQLRQTDEPWHSLWSALCHQNDVHTATYAAVPHIVAMARERQAEDRKEHLLLAGHAECCRHLATAPPIPDDLRDAYEKALDHARALLPGTIQATADQDECRHLLAALAALLGHPRLAAGIECLDPVRDCPKCGANTRTPGYDRFEERGR